MILIATRNHDEIVRQRVDLLTLKNHLVEVSSEELCDVSREDDYYEFFLESSLRLLLEEPAFLLLDDILLQKISKVASEQRYRYHNSPIYSFSNDLIVGVNELLYLPEFKKKSRVFHYLAFQEDCRKKTFSSISDSLLTNARDLWVYRSIQDQEDYLTEMDVLSGLRYFSFVCPELFQDSDFMKGAEDFVDSCCALPIYRRLGKQYHLAVDTQKILQKVKKSSR